MPDVNWSTVWTAVVTAGFVTLAIEYAAKPRLEARKEDILAGLRARREVKTLIVQMTMAAQKYGAVLPTGVDRELGQRWKEERDRQYDMVVDRVRQLVNGLDLYAGTYREPLLSLDPPTRLPLNVG
ncbi:hypothetical protein EDC02_2422 [Micromonospora sp. Llam0]|uniref:hypothetical protein n=1 Tax=Micromonospora sp. Llam0 TaxID=2485143 RepID=UPI000FB3B02F|nr:hypothetical protein [Micromonospora sp. Llam0]ROO60532.1 hypothetical protein EDC02_2422 [Micromonospora sp. Llam0]